MIATRDMRARLAGMGTGADAAIDLAEAALLLATMERPGAALDPYRRHLDRLVGEVGTYTGDPERADVTERAEALRQVIGKRYGYRAEVDGADDPDDGNLIGVIDRRRGHPALLAVIYVHAARALGWSAAAIDFPARTIVRLESAGQRRLLDPADGGRCLSPQGLRALLKAVGGMEAELTPDHFRAASNRDILFRIQNGLKLRLLRNDRVADALVVLETLALLTPDRPVLWRELGLLNARLDNLEPAITALETYLTLNTGERARYHTSLLLQELRARLN